MVISLSTALVTLLASMTIGQASRSSNKETPQDLISRWVEVSGGAEAYGKLESWKRSWAVQTPKGDATMEMIGDTSGRFFGRRAIEKDDRMMTEGCNGQLAWRINWDGKASLLQGVEKYMMQIMEDPAWGLHADRYFKRMVTSGKVDFFQAKCWQVVGLLPDKSRIELFFEEKTGQWIGMEYNVGKPSNRMKVQIRFRNFKKQDGIITPFQIIAGNEKRPSTNARLQTLEFNPDLESDQFKLPQSVLAIEGTEDLPTISGQDESAAGGTSHKRLISMIGSEIVDMSGKKVSSAKLSEKKNVLLYFSASWCPPCKRFTPGLVEFFKKNAPEKDFTIVFVSSDRSQDAMMKYMQDYNMDFWAVPFDRVNPSGIKSTYGDKGIPNLVWLNASDEPVAKSYVNGSYVGPAKVLNDFGQSIGVN